MSSGDDVLDSWEDIDEAGLTSQVNQISKEFKSNSEAISFKSSAALMMVMRPDEDYGSTYRQAAKPAVKILRRPISHSSAITPSETRPKQPIKTLQQREQEYAEARLRILGAAKNPDDELQASIPKVVTKSTECAEDRTFLEVGRTNGESCSPSFLVNGQMRPQDILRMPRGPDGTSGFNLQR